MSTIVFHVFFPFVGGLAG